MKGVTNKFLKLLFAVLLIINTIPKNLYADEGEVYAPVQEEIVETVEEPSPEPVQEPVEEPISEVQPNAPPAEEKVETPSVERPVEDEPAPAAEETKEETEVEETVYVIYFEASDHGLISLANEGIGKEKIAQEVKTKDELVSLKAEADEGYEFVEWKLNGVHFSNEPLLKAQSIELKDQDKYSASFKKSEVEAKEEEPVEEPEIPEEEVLPETEEEAEPVIEEEAETTIQAVLIYFDAGDNGILYIENESSMSFIQEVILKEELHDVEAKADEGFEFKEWLLNNEHFSDEAILKAEDIALNDEDRYTAVFKQVEEVQVEEEVPEESEEIWPKEFYKITNGMSVRVTYQEGTFPEGTEMVVTAIPENEVYDVVDDAIDGIVSRIKAVDITFYSNGKEVEPEKPVTVFMKAYGADDSKEQSVVHIDDENNVDVIASADVQYGTAVTEFSTTDFSIYAVVESGEDARLKVVFNSGSEQIASIYVKKSDADNIEQILYDPGAGSLDEGVLFEGWVSSSAYSANDEAKTIIDVRAEVLNRLNADNITDGEIVNYYAI